MGMKNIHFYGIMLLIFIAGIISRWLLTVENFGSMDSVSYALATQHYSIQDNMPPPPGYFLYIMSGKFLNLWFQDPKQSLLFLSVFYSGLIPVVLFFLGYLLFGTFSGVSAALLFLTSPVFWYKGITIYGYLNAAFFILLTATFCYKVILGKSSFIYWASVSYALCVGVRPQEFPMLLPLYGWALTFVSRKQAMAGVGFFALVCMAWFIPLMLMSGGLMTYGSLLNHGSGYLVENSILGGSWINQINNHLSRMAPYIERSYFLGLIPLIYFIGQFFQFRCWVSHRNVQFLLLLFIPTLIFNVFVQFAEIGHGLAWGVGLFLLIGESVIVFGRDLAQIINRKLEAFSVGSVLTTVCVVNGVMFFHDFKFDVYDYRKISYDDRQFNYQDAQSLDRHLSQKFDFIEKQFGRETEKLVIVSKRFFYQAMMKFPKAHVILPDVVYRDQKKTIQYCHQLQCQTSLENNIFEIPEGKSRLVVMDDPAVHYVECKEDCHLETFSDSSQILVASFNKEKKLRLTLYSIQMD